MEEGQKEREGEVEAAQATDSADREGAEVIDLAAVRETRRAILKLGKSEQRKVPPLGVSHTVIIYTTNGNPLRTVPGEGELDVIEGRRGNSQPSQEEIRARLGTVEVGKIIDEINRGEIPGTLLINKRGTGLEKILITENRNFQNLTIIVYQMIPENCINDERINSLLKLINEFTGGREALIVRMHGLILGWAQNPIQYQRKPKKKKRK